MQRPRPEICLCLPHELVFLTLWAMYVTHCKYARSWATTWGLIQVEMESLIHLTMSRPWISSCWLEKHILMREFNIHQRGPRLCVFCSRLINLIRCGQGLHSAVCSIAQQQYCCTVLPLTLALPWWMHSIQVSRREESACSMQPKLSTWYRTTDNSTEAPAQCWVQCCTTWRSQDCSDCRHGRWHVLHGLTAPVVHQHMHLQPQGNGVIFYRRS